MKEYAFVTHYFTGGLETRSEGHRELIRQKAAEGWRYAGFFPTGLNHEGVPFKVDLIFERDRAEDDSR